MILLDDKQGIHSFHYFYHGSRSALCLSGERGRVNHAETSPWVGRTLVCSRSSEEANVSAVKGWIEEVIGNEVKERIL